MARDRKPYWIDHLFEKHECFDYDKPARQKVKVGDREVEVLYPSYVPKSRC